LKIAFDKKIERISQILLQEAPWFDYSPADLKHDLDTLKEIENKGR